MSGGDDSPPPQPTNTTVTNVNMPEWMKGPTLDAIGAAKTIYNAPIAGYEEGVPADQRIGRIAEFAPAQERAFRGITSLDAPQGFTDANRALDMAQGRVAGMQDPAAYDAAQRAFNTAQSGIAGLQTPDDIAAARAAMEGDANFGTQRFGANQAAFYMNPYAQRVLDVSARQATEASAREAAKLAARSASMGAYGGYGQNVAEGIRQRTLSQDIGDLYTRGLGEAYDKAAALYGEDEARRLAAAEFRQKTAQGRANLGAKEQGLALDRLRALQEAGRAQQDLGTTRQETALKRADMLRDMGLSQAEVGNLIQDANLKRLVAQSDVGKQRQALEQYKKDIAYQDYLRQRDLPMEKLKFYSDIIRGISPNLGSTEITYSTQPSTSSQVLSLGLSGLGLLNASKGS